MPIFSLEREKKGVVPFHTSPSLKRSPWNSFLTPYVLHESDEPFGLVVSINTNPGSESLELDPGLGDVYTLNVVK